MKPLNKELNVIRKVFFSKTCHFKKGFVLCLTREGCCPPVILYLWILRGEKITHLAEEIEFDPRLCVPFSCQIVGPSGSGKTHFVKNVLENCKDVMQRVPDNIVWIYTSCQPMYDELQQNNKKIKSIEGLPDSFDDPDLFPPHHSHLVILDDVLLQAAEHPEVARIFTQYRHHKNMSMMLLTQNLFYKGKYSRTISLNTNYLVLFNNPRDKLQIFFFRVLKTPLRVPFHI